MAAASRAVISDAHLLAVNPVCSDDPNLNVVPSHLQVARVFKFGSGLSDDNGEDPGHSIVGVTGRGEGAKAVGHAGPKRWPGEAAVGLGNTWPVHMGADDDLVEVRL